MTPIILLNHFQHPKPMWWALKCPTEWMPPHNQSLMLYADGYEYLCRMPFQFICIFLYCPTQNKNWIPFLGWQFPINSSVTTRSDGVTSLLSKKIHQIVIAICNFNAHQCPEKWYTTMIVGSKHLFPKSQVEFIEGVLWLMADET